MLIPTGTQDSVPRAGHRSRQSGDSEAPAESPASQLPTGAVIDVEGTILDGNGRPLPGAIEVIGGLKEARVPFSLASNLSSKTLEQLAHELQRKGFTVDTADIVTTSSLTAEYLRRHHHLARVAVFAEGTPFSADDGLVFVSDKPDVIVLGGLGKWLSHEALNKILRFACEGVPLVAMHRNLCWESATGLSLDVGGVLPGIEAVAHREAQVIGKPSRAFFEQALVSGGIKLTGALMVGDDVRSDVLAAQAMGMTGVLVRTGKYRSDTLAGADGSPDFVIDSIADLPALMAGGEWR